MSIKASPELNNLLFVLIGERLLQADEDLAYASRRPYHRLGERMSQLSTDIERSVLGISRSLPPEVGSNYLKSMKLFIDNGGTNHLNEFSDQLRTIGNGRTDTSMNITESKWQIIAELIRLLIELTIIFVMSFFTAGASASDAAVAKARSRVAVLTVLDQLLKRTHLMPTVSQALEEAFTTFAVRLAMMAAGPDGRRPKGFDWKAIVQDGIIGGFGGLFHGGLSSGFDKILKNFTSPAKNIAGDITSKAIRPSSFSVKNLGNTTLNDAKSFLVSGGSETLAEFVGGGLTTGNWTTTWDTFLGSGISSKAESALSHAASKPGTWAKNNFADVQVNTSSRVDANAPETVSETSTEPATNPETGTTKTPAGPLGSTGPAGPLGSTGPAPAKNVSTSSNGDEHTTLANSTDDTDGRNGNDGSHEDAIGKSPQPPVERTLPPTSTSAHSVPSPTPNALRADSTETDVETRSNAEADPDNDTEPSTGLLTENGSSDTGPPLPATNAQPAPQHTKVPEHQLWKDFLSAPDDQAQQILADIADHRRGDVPTQEEITLRSEVYQQLNAVEGGITIVIDDAANFGHQAAATMLMDSLDELGYGGPITAIAPGNVQDKLKLLLSDELRARVTWQTHTFDPENPVADPRASGGTGAQGLVLVAASDRLDADSTAATQFLDFLGTDRAIVLKPYAWNDSHRYLYSRQAAGFDAQVTDLESSPTSEDDAIASGALFNFHTPVLGLDALATLIDHRVTDRAVASGLKAVAQAVHRHDTEVMPVYGLHNVDDPGRVSALSTLASGIHQAGIGKPSVILSFGRTTVDHAPAYTETWLHRTRLTADDLEEQLGRLDPGDVLIVQCDNIPQDVFRQLFQLGTLPAVLEGANTTNLMQLVGRPYFSALTNHTPYDSLDPIAVNHLKQVTRAITWPSAWGRKAQRLTDEASSTAWSGFQNVGMAQSVLSALPRSENGRGLTRSEVDRLTAAGVLTTDQLRVVLGHSQSLEAVISDKWYIGQRTEITEEQLNTLQTRLETIRAQHLSEVRTLMDTQSVIPEQGATEVVAEAIRELTDPGSRLHTYFTALRAKANDPRNDQTLQALRRVLTVLPPLPRTTSRVEYRNPDEDSQGSRETPVPRWQTDWFTVDESDSDTADHVDGHIDREDDSEDDSDNEGDRARNRFPSSQSISTSSRSSSSESTRSTTGKVDENHGVSENTAANEESGPAETTTNPASDLTEPIEDTNTDHNNDDQDDDHNDNDSLDGINFFSSDDESDTPSDENPSPAPEPPVPSTSAAPQRLLLRSARSFEAPAVDADDLVQQSVGGGATGSSLFASYTQSDWSQRSERFRTVADTTTFQDHHHSEQSLYRTPRQVPWDGQRVSIFAAHGSPTRVIVTRDDDTAVEISGRELGRYLNHSGDPGSQDRPIVLYACSTGASPTHGGLSVAQHVANVTRRPVYAPSTTTGTAIDSEQQVRPVLFRDSDNTPGQWMLFVPEPMGEELDELTRTAGLHTTSDAPGPWDTSRTLQLVRTLRNVFGPGIEQSPDHASLLAALGALDSERFTGDEAVWGPYGDSRMTADLLRRIALGLEGTDAPGLARYSALFDRVVTASSERTTAPPQEAALSPAHHVTREASPPSQPSTQRQEQEPEQQNEHQNEQDNAQTQQVTAQSPVPPTNEVPLVVAQLDNQRPATVDAAMQPAPPEGAVQQFPGGQHLPTYVTGDGENPHSGFTYGQSQVVQRGINDVIDQISASNLPVPDLRASSDKKNPLAELEQALNQTPHLFHGDGWISTPFKDTKGRLRQLRVFQRPQGPWSMLTNEQGEPLTLDPVKVDQIHRSQITSGTSETSNSTRQFGLSAPLGPPGGPVSAFGRVGLSLGFMKSVDFNLQDQTLSQVETRHSDASHLYLGDVMYTVELTDAAPEQRGVLERIAGRFRRATPPPAGQNPEGGSDSRITFGVKNGVLLRLSDHLTAELASEHAPATMRLDEHSDYRTVHTEGYGSVAAIHAWALKQAGAVVGSRIHHELTRFFSSENFLRTADRMAHGPVTSEPLFTDSGAPTGVFVVDKVVPGEATLLSETDAAELRNAIQRVIKNDRSASSAYSQDLQFALGPSFNPTGYSTSAAQPRVQVAGFTQLGNRSTRTIGFGGSGSRKIVGRARKVRTELYLVQKSVYVRMSGQRESKKFLVWTLDRMTRAEARRLAGWDDGTKLRISTPRPPVDNSAEVSSENPPENTIDITREVSDDGENHAGELPHPNEPLPPVYLPRDNPTLLGMARLEAFLPDSPPSTAPNPDGGAVPPTPTSFLTTLMDDVIAAVAEKHPGIVAPLSDFTSPSDTSKGWRGKNHFSTALLNTLTLIDALSHHSMAGQLESFASDGLRIRLIDTTGTKRKYRWIWVTGTLTDRRYEGTRNELILRSSTPGTQRLDSSGTVSHTKEVGVDIGVSARETAADSFGQPINSGVITPSARYAWQKTRRTGSGATVSYEPLHATSGPSHVFSYQLSISVSSGGFWRFRDPLRFLGLLGSGLSVGRTKEIDLIGGTSHRPPVTGKVLLDVPDEHIPPTAPEPEHEQEQDPEATELTTAQVQALLDGRVIPLEPDANAHEDTDRRTDRHTDEVLDTDTDRVEEADANTDASSFTERTPLHPFTDLPHQVIAVSGGSKLRQGLEKLLKNGSGGTWQFSLYGAAPHDAVMRQFQPQVLASFLDQTISRTGSRMVQLFGVGPYANRIGKLIHRASLLQPVVRSKPIAVETESTLGTETQVSHVKTSVTVGKLNLGLAYARSHDQGPSLIGTYGLVVNGTFTDGHTATLTNTVSVENDRDDENQKYLVTADVQHQIGFMTQANGLLSPLRKMLPALRSRYAGLQLTVPSGWLGHVPEKTAHRLGLVGKQLPPAPQYEEDSWSPSPWLQDTPFGSFPVNALDSAKVAQDFDQLLKAQGVDDAGRDHILDMVSPRALLALRQQMAATQGGVTAVTRTAWTKLGKVFIGSQPATVLIELIPESTAFDGIDHSVTFQETLGITETIEVSDSRAVTTTVAVSVTEAIRTQNPSVPTVGPTLNDSLSDTRQRALTTSASRTKSYTFYPNEPHADFLTDFTLRMVLIKPDGTRFPPVEGPVGLLREQLPLSLAVPDTDNSDTGNDSSDQAVPPVSAPVKVTFRQTGPLTDVEIAAWRRGSDSSAFTMPSNGFMPRRITDNGTALDAAQLAMAKAYEGKLPHLPKKGGPVDLTGSNLSEALRKARLSGPARQGRPSGQALSDGLSSTQTAAFFGNTTSDSGYLAATVHDAAVALDTEGSYRLFSRPLLKEAVLLSVAPEATMESPERQTVSADAAVTFGGTQNTTTGLVIGTSPPLVGAVSPAPTGGGMNTGESGTLKIASADGTQLNVKPKTGRALLFSIPTDWLGEATIVRGKVVSALGLPRSTSQVVEYRTNVLAWVREDVARELGLINDTDFPSDVTDAWTAVAAASKEWVNADKAYWQVRRTVTEATGNEPPGPEQLRQLDESATTAREAMREFRRVRAAADRLTHWYRGTPRPVGTPPPPVTFTPPASPTGPVIPTYTGTAFVPESEAETGAPPTLVSPSGDTYALHDVPEDGDAFFHALTLGLRHTGTWPAGLGHDADDTDTPLAGLRGRMTDTLTNDADDLLDFTTPDLLDRFDPRELENGGPTFEEGSPEAREFADPAHTLPLYARFSADERRALALAQLGRYGTSTDSTGWDHGTADLLPALAARTFGVTVTVVRDDGTFQQFAPPSSTPSTGQVVLYLKDRHYQAALPPRSPDLDTTDADDGNDSETGYLPDDESSTYSLDSAWSDEPSVTESDDDGDDDSETGYAPDDESSTYSLDSAWSDEPSTSRNRTGAEDNVENNNTKKNANANESENESSTDDEIKAEAKDEIEAEAETETKDAIEGEAKVEGRAEDKAERESEGSTGGGTPTPPVQLTPSLPPTSNDDTLGPSISDPDVLGQVLDMYGVRDIVVQKVNLRPLGGSHMSARAALDLTPGGLSMRDLELTDHQILTVLAHHRQLAPEAVEELLKHPSYAGVLRHTSTTPFVPAQATTE
ncbi:MULTISPECIES: hypothetical protein [unclassified Streptomyces]|uniref:hypothetical protein n=1 Tax=unclassified Streptomyces TaxID=2593676 RepID=UPI0036E69372